MMKRPKKRPLGLKSITKATREPAPHLRGHSTPKTSKRAAPRVAYRAARAHAAGDESRAIQHSSAKLHRAMRRLSRQAAATDRQAEAKSRLTRQQERQAAAARHRRAREDLEALRVAAQYGAPGMSKLEARNLLRQLRGMPDLQDPVSRALQRHTERARKQHHFDIERARQQREGLAAELKREHAGLDAARRRAQFSKRRDVDPT